MKSACAWLVVGVVACGQPAQPTEATHAAPSATHTAIASATVPTAAATVEPPPPTRCQTIEAHFDARLRDAFTKANADALAAVREQRDPISKRLVIAHAALDKARAANATTTEIAKLTEQIAKLEDRRSRAHPSRTDAALMGLDTLQRGTVCVDGHDAAWALTLSSVEVVSTDSPEWDEPAAWTIRAERVVVHFDGAGDESIVPVDTVVGAIPKDTSVIGKRLAPRDLDGDKIAEWYVLVGGPNVAPSYRVITFRDGAVRAYGHKPPMDITDIVTTKDEIAFAHYDLLGSYKPCNRLQSVDVWGPKLAIDVSSDGTFSMTTAPARERNKTFCSAMPSRIVQPEDVVCAKLLGADAQTVGARIRKDNKPMDCDKPVQYDGTREPNELLPFLLTAAKLPVPYSK